MFVRMRRVCNCYLEFLKYVESFPASHQVSAFPSADCLKERRALYPYVPGNKGTPLYMPNYQDCSLSRLWSLTRPQRLSATDAKKKNKKKTRPPVFSLLTLYNVVNACFDPFLCALGRSVEVEVLADRRGHARRQTAETPLVDSS